MRQILD